MRKLLLAAGVASLSLTIPAVAKDPGGSKGGGGKPAHAQKADKGPGGGKAAKANRGGGERQAKDDRNFAKPDRKADRSVARADAKAEKNWRKSEAKADKQWAKEERRFRDDRGSVGFVDRTIVDGRRFAEGSGCPPGLAKKGNGCLPPGQAKRIYGLGERLPLAYYPDYNVPSEYRNWYADTDDYSYRFDDGYIYRVDNDSGLIGGLIPLLGGGFGVGNRMPAGYDTYNLPYPYRDDYYDTQDAYYRYGDDAIYRVNPQTSIIESVVALLAGDLNVGQALPSGYDTYNLPMSYRDQYADSGEAWYRYADGNIYEVDPQSRMIEAIVASLV